MVAPPPGPSANRWLASYKGKVLLYAGEGRGGASADEEFFASIEKGWRLVAKHTLKPFPGWRRATVGAGAAVGVWVVLGRDKENCLTNPRRP